MWRLDSDDGCNANTATLHSSGPAIDPFFTASTGVSEAVLTISTTPAAFIAHTITADTPYSAVSTVDPMLTEPIGFFEDVSSTPATSTTFAAHNPTADLSHSLTTLEHNVDSADINGDCVAFSGGFPDIPGDLKAIDFTAWGSWSAPRRVAAVRRWIIYASHKYGPVDRWAEDFSQKWGIMRHKEAGALDRWLDSIRQMIRMGRCVLNYLERAMEGELPESVDAWRDLHAQSYQLAGQLWRAILGVQHRLDSAVLVRNPVGIS